MLSNKDPLVNDPFLQLTALDVSSSVQMVATWCRGKDQVLQQDVGE